VLGKACGHDSNRCGDRGGVASLLLTDEAVDVAMMGLSKQIKSGQKGRYRRTHHVVKHRIIELDHKKKANKKLGWSHSDCKRFFLLSACKVAHTGD
jgi:hypothetical protein